MKWLAVALPVALIFSFYFMSEKEEHGFAQKTVVEDASSVNEGTVEPLRKKRDQALQEAERQGQLAERALQSTTDVFDPYDHPSSQYQSNVFDDSDHSCIGGDCSDNEYGPIDPYDSDPSDKFDSATEAKLQLERLKSLSEFDREQQIMANNGTITIGMPKRLVTQAWGVPNRINKNTTGREQWFYRESSRSKHVYFDNSGKVTSFGY